MARIHLVQLLCPNRHCIIAAAWEEGRTTYEATVTFMRASFAGMGGEWLCGLCRAAELKFEDGLMPFNSMAEAAPELARLAAENMRGRALIEQLRRGARN